MPVADVFVIINEVTLKVTLNPYKRKWDILLSKYPDF